MNRPTLALSGKAVILFAAVLALLPAVADAGLSAVGHEFRPTASERDGIDPCVAADGSSAKVYFRCEFTTANGACDSDSGEPVVEWRSADGTLVSGPVSLGFTDSSRDYGFACAGDGAVMVISEGRVAVVDPGGRRESAATVCGDSSCSAYQPGIAATTDGFFAAWAAEQGTGLFGRCFTSDGVAAGDTIRILELPTGNRIEGTMTALVGASIVIGWRERSMTDYSLHVRAVVIDSSGAAGVPVDLSEAATGLCLWPMLRVEEAGTLVASWRNPYTQGGWVSRRMSLDDSTATTTTTTTTLDPDALRFVSTRELFSLSSSAPPYFSLAGDADGQWAAGWTGYVDDTSYQPVVATSLDDARRWLSPLARPLQPGPAAFDDVYEATVATDGNGVWIQAGADYRGEHLQFNRSTDAGQHWGERQVFYAVERKPDFNDQRYELSNVAVAGGAGGHWVAAWSEGFFGGRYIDSRDEYEHTSSCAIRSSVSIDSGRTWAPASTLDQVPCYSVTAVTVATDHSGNWLVAWSGDGISASHSIDNAATWSPAAKLLRTRHRSPQQLSVAANRDGGWLLAYVGWIADPLEDRKPRVFVSRSSSVLSEWTVPAALAPWHDEEGGGDYSPSVAAGDDGQFAIAWSSYSSGGGLDADVVTSFSSDSGATWTMPALVDPAEATDALVDRDPKLQHAGANTWAVLWLADTMLSEYAGHIGPIRLARTIGACGNGTIEVGESCDDGNRVGGDGCDSTCRPTGCGSEAVTGAEQCDDGNDDDTDDCLSNCRSAVCGDGAKHGDLEECDDGNTNENDGCLSSCHIAMCGDGFVQNTVEECDDGDERRWDAACLASCRAARCGDGYIWAGVEQCDDGNLDGGDRCTRRCRLDLVCPDGDGERVTATGALLVLRKAVGLDGRCPRRRCDRNGDGRVTAIDALGTLRLAVGLVVDACSVARKIDLVLTSDEGVAALQFDVDYMDAAGDLVAIGETADCEILVPQVVSATHLQQGRALLSVGVISLKLFHGPVTLARCTFHGSATPASADFHVTIVDATDDLGNQIEPRPVVTVVPE